MLTRRALLSGALAAPALSLVPTGAFAATAAGGVRVDVSPLVASGLGPNAGRIKSLLERYLAAGRQAGRGGLLTVKVTGHFMASYAGGGGGAFGAGGNDSLESETRLIDGGGRVIASFPILSSSPAASGGAWYDPDSDARRLDMLVRNHAAWITRRIAG